MPQEVFSRRGAKGQRKASGSRRTLLCTFAPLRARSPFRGLRLTNFQLALVLIVVLGANAAGAGTLGQETSSAPLQNDKGLTKDSSAPTAKAGSKKAATRNTPDQDKDATAKKPKRGQLVIAPIPATSPAVGAGLILEIGRAHV